MKIGILGGGQLGRMLALAGRPLGLEFGVYEPSPNPPSAPAAPTTMGSFDDESALEAFITDCDVVTYELEHLPLRAVELVAAKKPVYPPPLALAVGQDRLREKELFQTLGIPTPRFAPIRSSGDLSAALSHVGLPAVLKTVQLGYDGKGQRIVRTLEDGIGAWSELGERTLIAEEFIPFEREVSVIAVRSAAGEVKFYPLVQNVHRRGILERSDAPAPDRTSTMQCEAEDFCSRILKSLDYVGILTIEFFVRSGHLVANEMAPRVHNSGHWTIEGAVCSQFENHIRAVSGLALGSTAVAEEWTMFNLIGGAPSEAQFASVPSAHVHLYGKVSKPGRKIGHVTALRRDAAAVEPLVQNILAPAEPR